MKSLKKFLAVISVIALVAVMFSACSGGSSSDSGSSESTTAAAAQEKVKVIDINLSDEEYAFGVNKDEADLLSQANDYIKEIKDNGQFDEICNHYFSDGEPVAVTSAEEDSSKDQLVVATNAEFEPFEYKKGESFLGIDMEIAKGLAEKLGKELVIKDMKFDAVVTAVQQGKADIAMAGLTVTPERSKQVTFTDSYYDAAQKLVVKGDDTTFDSCKTKEDVEAILKKTTSSTTIGGQTGTTAQSYVEGSEDMGFDGIPATFKGYDNASLAIQDLINGNITYAMVDAAPAQAITNAINAVA